MSETASPLILATWERELKTHPDRAFAEFILRGIKEGFRVGYESGKAELKQRVGNMISASEKPEVISEYLQNEMEMKRVRSYM